MSWTLKTESSTQIYLVLACPELQNYKFIADFRSGRVFVKNMDLLYLLEDQHMPHKLQTSI